MLILHIFIAHLTLNMVVRLTLREHNIHTWKAWIYIRSYEASKTGKIENAWFIKDPRIPRKTATKTNNCVGEYINRSNKHDKIRSRINRNRVVCYRTPSCSRRRSIYTYTRHFCECARVQIDRMRERISASVYARPSERPCLTFAKSSAMLTGKK